MNLVAFEVSLDMGLWEIIGLVKGLLFLDTRPLLERMSTLCGQFTNMLGAMLFTVNESSPFLFYFFLYFLSCYDQCLALC